MEIAKPTKEEILQQFEEYLPKYVSLFSNYRITYEVSLNSKGLVELTFSFNFDTVKSCSIQESYTATEIIYNECWWQRNISSKIMKLLEMFNQVIASAHKN